MISPDEKGPLKPKINKNFCPTCVTLVFLVQEIPVVKDTLESKKVAKSEILLGIRLFICHDHMK